MVAEEQANAMAGHIVSTVVHRAAAAEVLVAPNIDCMPVVAHKMVDCKKVVGRTGFADSFAGVVTAAVGNMVVAIHTMLRNTVGIVDCMPFRDTESSS